MPQFIYFIEPVRERMPELPTPEEGKAMADHFAYLQAQLAKGKLVMAGRTLTPPFVGIAIFEAEDEAAAAKFAQNDPAVARGVVTARVQPYKVALMRQS